VKNVSGFATHAFLEFSKQAVTDSCTSGISNTLGQNASYGYFIINKNNILFPNGAQFIVSPICLSGAADINFCQELEIGELTKMDIAGGFLQTRDDRENEVGFSSTGHFYYYIDTRTNYRLDLGLSDEMLLGHMKRDSRARIRKIIKDSSNYELLNVSDNAEPYSNVFSHLYDDTATQGRFDSQYFFKKNTWLNLLSNPLWGLYILKYKNEVVAGAILSDLPNGYDYTFMGYKQCDIDVSRALIYFIYKFLSNQGKGFLDLGGGIQENDSLARFKLGLGAYKTNFKRVRFVRRNVLGAGIHEGDLREHLMKRWP